MKNTAGANCGGYVATFIHGPVLHCELLILQLLSNEEILLDFIRNHHQRGPREAERILECAR